jgi:hypothetical protein
MPHRERERRILEAKIAGAERRQADLRAQSKGALRATQEAALDLELMELRRKLRDLRGG